MPRYALNAGHANGASFRAALECGATLVGGTTDWCDGTVGEVSGKTVKSQRGPT